MDIIKENRGVIIFEGILFLLLGILAIALPVWFTFGFEQLIGWLVLIGGLIQAYRSYQLWNRKGFWASVLSAVLGILIGGLLIARPMAGVLTLTLLLTFFFFLEGLAKIFLSFDIKDHPGWGWLLLSGLLSLGLGILIISGWPSTALWVIGLLVGINMLFFGASLLGLAWSTSKA